MNEEEKKNTVKIFGIASFLNDLGSDMVFPIWPVFVTSVLGADMAILGLIDGLGDAFVALSQAFSGYLSDRIGKRKIFVYFGYMLAGLARLGYAVSTMWQMLIPFRSIDRIGKMRGAPRDAIVADISTNKNRGRNFGFLRSMDNAGATCGVLVSIAIFPLIGYRGVFFLAAIPSLVAALVVYRYIKEEKSERKIFKGLALKGASRDLRLYFISSGLFALASFTYSFLLLAAKYNGFSVSNLPLFYLTFSIVAALTSLYFGKLADRIGRKPVLLFSYFLWAAMCLALVHVDTFWSAVGAFVIYGLHQGASEPVERTIASELSDPEFRSSTLGVYQFITGIMALPASLLAGLLWDYTGSPVGPLFISTGLTVCASLVLIFVRESKTEGEVKHA